MSNIIQIPLDKGMFALINSEDYELVSKYKWYAMKGRTTHYAICSNIKNLFMHRLILGLKPYKQDRKFFADHKDHNGLNNTRDNIRIVTHIQNNCNKRSYKNVSSKFKGVYWNKEKRKWTAQITKPGDKTKHVGHFNFEIDAALAYNEMAKKLHGEFACLNTIM